MDKIRCVTLWHNEYLFCLWFRVYLIRRSHYNFIIDFNVSVKVSSTYAEVTSIEETRGKITFTI